MATMVEYQKTSGFKSKYDKSEAQRNRQMAESLCVKNC